MLCGVVVVVIAIGLAVVHLAGTWGAVHLVGSVVQATGCAYESSPRVLQQGSSQDHQRPHCYSGARVEVLFRRFADVRLIDGKLVVVRTGG